MVMERLLVGLFCGDGVAEKVVGEVPPPRVSTLFPPLQPQPRTCCGCVGCYCTYLFEGAE